MVRRFRYGIVSLLSLCICFLALPPRTNAQAQPNSNSFSTTWLLLQSVPSMNWTTFQDRTQFAFEWEATPLIYSWGMNKLDPPIHLFRVTQPERFAGSVEINLSAQLYTSSLGSSHWGFSGQLVGHFPLMEYGEHIGLDLGIARYTLAGSPSTFVIGGLSTLFGFFHYNIKYSPEDKIWMNTIEFRFF
jgi:hypothetical protein